MNRQSDEQHSQHSWAANIPNMITVVRMALVVPLTVLLVQQRYGLALLIFFLAGASDGVDGFVARRFSWRSRLGSILDPIADKLLLVSCYFVLTTQGLIPAWLLAIVLGRDMIIILGAIVIHHWITEVDGEPTLISKLNTFLQIALVLAILVDQTYGWLQPAWLTALVWSVTITTALSGIHYMSIWAFKLRRIDMAGPAPSEMERSDEPD
ncbi:MAG: CDP-alcohol phosphatidyltransferase family protein [Xanthomonadales bacterium]|nr:CDP-alcohol phosphatidyltransferase family protein [Xanthomonadales bacterium]